MGIKKYLQNKKNKQQSKDILQVIKETIYTLEGYAQKLENGEAHPNIKKLSGEEKKFAENMADNEKLYVQNAIKSLYIAYEKVSDHKIIDTITPNRQQEEKTR